jgi:hypothetical protein
MSGRLIRARFLACPAASAQDRIPDRPPVLITQNEPISRIRHARLRFPLSSAAKFPAALRKLTQTFGDNGPVLVSMAAHTPPGSAANRSQPILKGLTMQTPIETNALYLVVSAVPLLHGLDRDIVDPSILMTTAWLLAATFAACHLLRRRTDRSPAAES